MKIQRILPAILILFLFLPKVLWGQTSFSFSLGTDAQTSAGVFKTDGTLVKTLWSNVKLNSGSHTKSWDGTDEEGRLVAKDNYQVKIISNNMSYVWEGVVGNNSAELNGPTVHRGFERVFDLAAAGNTVYMAIGYAERTVSQIKFNTATPQRRAKAFADDGGTGLESYAVATDGKTVYWGGVDPFSTNKNVSFIAGTNVADDKEVLFANGSPYKTILGRNYPKALSVVNAANSKVTGLAVQKTGQFLFASRRGLNTLYVLNKTTGAAVRTLSFASVYNIAVDGSDNLWVHYLNNGVHTIQKYSVNSDGTLSSLGVSITNLSSPQGLTVSYDGSAIVVADGGNSQQLKAYSTANGSPVWTYGQAGGYASNATVADNKFYFDDPSLRTQKSDIVFLSDGSFWVIDGGNYRVQHYSSSRTYLERIMYLPHIWTSAVDKNNPTRIFADYLEFSVDYSKPLGTNNGSWSLVKNWGYNVPRNYDNEFNRLRFATTLSNGRTYAFQKSGTSWQVVELVATGAMRWTGLILSNNHVQLYPDGSLRRISSTNMGSPVQFIKKPLTGFDGSGNPQWGADQIMATSPPRTNQDPLYYGVKEMSYTAGEVTSSNIVVSFDGGLPPTYGSSGYHLGAIKAGDNKWLWRTAKSTRSDYKGEFPTDGSYDIGNGSQYAGSLAMVMDRSIFWGFHGEFWKGGQVNKWNHVYDNGLLLGQFGTTTFETIGEAAPMMAGNAFAGNLVKAANGQVYLYHNDESYHGGIHRWKISGFNTIQEQSVPITFSLSSQQGLLAEYFDKNDLNNFHIKTRKVDPKVEFNWSTGSPAGTGVSVSDNFGVKWSGYLKPLFTENYTFYAKVDGGVRLYVDNKLIIDRATNQTSTEFSGSVSLAADKQHSIRLEYFEYSGDANCTLSWSSTKQPKQVIPTSQLIPAFAPVAAEGVDLLEGLPPATVLQNNMYGWSRNPTSEDLTNYIGKWWSVKTSVRGVDQLKSPDLYMRFRQASGSYYVARDLGNHTLLNSWKLAGIISLDEHYPNAQDAGMFFDVLDQNGKVITRFYASIDYSALPYRTTIYGNTKAIAQDTDDNMRVLFKRNHPLEIAVNGSGATIAFGPFASVTAPIFDATADWKSPKTLKISFFKTGGVFNLDRVIDIQSLRFSTNAGSSNSNVNITPTAPLVAASDESNTMSASHSLGLSEIVVSENGGAYSAYSGPINVGNVARAAGYWKFKTKAATGRNESSVVASPAFTEAPSTSCAGTGSILRDYWANISGESIAYVPVNSTPTSSSLLSSFEGPTNSGFQYASRVRGYICPPITGKYIFWISGDNFAELWLSTSNNPANKVRIAYASLWTDPRQWTKYPTQKSVEINLIAGQSYYIEALQKQVVGRDNLAVGWQLPDGSFERPIPGKRLTPFSSALKRTDEEETATEKDEIAVYPNPSSKGFKVKINVNLGSDFELGLYDLNGWLAKNLKYEKNTLDTRQEINIDTDALIDGVYFLKLTTSDKTLYKKLILNKE